MKRITELMTLTLLAFGLSLTANAEIAAIDSRKSHEMVTQNPNNAFIVDVRSQAEYELVGHVDVPNGSPNIPFKFYPGWRENPHFVDQVARRFSQDKTLIIMCRSGSRAKPAAAMLEQAGFKHVYYMSDSFEGPEDKNGHRTIGGWKLNGLPYTYTLDEDLVYSELDYQSP